MMHADTRGLKIYRVATYWDPATDGDTPRISKIRACIRTYSEEWPGFRMYEVEAATGFAATKAAKRMRLAHELERKGPVTADDEKSYYILDARSCVGNCALWWGKDSRGYTCNLDEAGLYTLEEALSHRDTDVPVHKDIARARIVQHVLWDHLTQHVLFTNAQDRADYCKYLRDCLIEGKEDDDGR